ncbi:MAG: T9SS type A sorting domain-containing protein [Bacteroidota bacterium]
MLPHKLLLSNKKHFSAFLMLFLLCCIGIDLHAQIAYDNNGIGIKMEEEITSFTVPAGFNRVLIVHAAHFGNNLGATFGDRSEDLTFSIKDADWLGRSTIYVFKLGTGCEVSGMITVKTGGGAGNARVIWAGSFQNVNQTDPVKDSGANTAAESAEASIISGLVNEVDMDVIIDAISVGGPSTTVDRIGKPGGGTILYEKIFSGDAIRTVARLRPAPGGEAESRFNVEGRFNKPHVAIVLDGVDAVTNPISPTFPSISGIVDEDPTDCIDNGTITINASGTNLEYSINNGTSFQSNNFFSGLAADNYNIIVREVGVVGCDAMGSASLSAPSAPEITNVVDGDPTDCALNNGTITINATGSNLEYSIDNGVQFQANNFFQNLASGDFNIVVREVGTENCTDTRNITLSGPVAPTITNVSTINPRDCELDNGTITINAVGNNLEYSIDNGENYQSDNLFDGLIAGDYEVVVRELGTNNCLATRNTSLSNPSTSTSGSICNDVTIELDGSGTATTTAEAIFGGLIGGCDGSNLELDRTSFDCGDIGSNTVVLTVTDIYDNISTCVATVTVEAGVALPDDFSTASVGPSLGDATYDSCEELFSLSSEQTSPYATSTGWGEFTYVSLEGDFTFTAEVMSLSSNGVAGLMVRKETGSGAVMGFVGKSGYQMTGGATLGENGSVIRRRSGRASRTLIFTVSRNGNTVTFKQGRTILLVLSLDLGTRAQAGLFVSSTNDAEATARFREVSYSTTNTPSFTQASNPSISSVKRAFEKVELMAWPNPLQDQVNVNLKSIIGKTAVMKIYNTIGEVVYTKNLGMVYEPLQQIDLSVLEDGVYIISIETGSKLLQNKIVKQN